MEEPTVIDYFSGPGGLAEGFSQAGYNTLMGIDYDKNSAETFKENHQDASYIRANISELNPEKVLKEAPVSKDDIDVVVGGPPCQGFSIAGDREQGDERNELFKDYARHIDHLRPKFVMMENVPGMLTMETSDGKDVIDEIQRKFSDLGYRTSYKKLLASDYGVPQNRERVILIGTRLEEGIISFPNRTHISDGDEIKLDELNSDFKEKVSVSDALSDLPSLDAGEEETQYAKKPQNSYQKMMRKNTSKEFQNHDAVNHRDHIVERFRHIPQGGDMTDAPEEHQPSKVYSSRNRRIEDSEPSYTVTSHVLDELIHPWDDRAITVREAARLQSFPDDYVFEGERNVFHGSDETSQYEQVGNAVPVVLSRKIAEEIKKQNFED